VGPSFGEEELLWMTIAVYASDGSRVGNFESTGRCGRNGRYCIFGTSVPHTGVERAFFNDMRILRSFDEAEVLEEVLEHEKLDIRCVH
jgi:hypothetical protein